MYGTHQLVILGDAIDLLRVNLSTVKKITEVLLVGSKKTDLGANAQQTMYEECPESKDTKVLNMYNIFNI